MAVASNPAVCLAVSLVVAATTFIAQPQPAAARCRQKAHSSPSTPAAAAEAAAGGGIADSSPNPAAAAGGSTADSSPSTLAAAAAAGGSTADSSPSSPAAAAAEGGATAADASPAALEFLRQRCNPGPMVTVTEEQYVGYCYASLLPHAGSFNGSRLRVIGAAVEVLVVNFRFLLAELRRLESTSGGGAYNLSECIDLAEVMSGDEAAGRNQQAEEPEMLARIRSLAASGDVGAVNDNDLLVMEVWLDEDVGAPYDRCVADVETIPNVETLLPTMSLIEPAMETCLIRPLLRLPATAGRRVLMHGGG